MEERLTCAHGRVSDYDWSVDRLPDGLQSQRFELNRVCMF